MDHLVFGYFAGVIALTAVLVVAFRNPIYSALSLLIMFFHVAGLYVTLHAEFLAAVQIIVYAGAILVLFLFVVMLLNAPHEDTEEDLEQLETILTLTRDLGVNLAGVEIILNMRRKIEAMQQEVNEFMDYVKKEMARGLDDWEQRLSTALVKSSPTDLVRHEGVKKNNS